MPENENTSEEVKAVEIGETVRQGLTMISNLVHARQSEVGYWPGEDGEMVDHRTFFAELHSKVATAYETYKEERDPTHITWIDPATGVEVEPGKGVPQGLSTDLVDIIFDILGFATNVGINMGGLVASIAMGMAAAPAISGDEAPDEAPDAAEAPSGDDEEDFDLEAILAAEVQGIPPSVDIEDPVAAEETVVEKKPEDT